MIVFTVLSTVALLAVLVASQPFPLNYVDPRIGTGGLGYQLANNNPAAQLPFSPLRLGPDTTLESIELPFTQFGNYAWHENRIETFSHTHVVGAGLPDFGNFGMMVLRTAMPSAAQITKHGYRSQFSHSTETMYPGYYAVYLDTHNTRAELTAAGTHTGVHQYTYSAAGGPVTLVLDVCTSAWNGEIACPEASVSFMSQADGSVLVDATIRNYGALSRRNGKGVWIYFHARIRSTSGPLQQYGIWMDRRVETGRTSRISEKSQSLGAYFNFGSPVGADVIVTVEVAISFVSPQLARDNLQTQLRGRSFAQAKMDAENIWANLLGQTAQLSASREKDLIKFYTGIYRTFMSPTNYAESDGSYIGMDELTHVVESGRGYFSDLSLWDTYRTQMPWLHLVASDVGADVSQSLVLQWQHANVLSRWPIASVITGCMFGDNANMVFLDAYRKGVRNFNVSAAYSAMRNNAMSPQPLDGRGNIEAYLQYGFIPVEYSNWGTPDTLAYAYNDWCLAEFAQILGYSDDEVMFRRRSTNWRNVFSADKMFMCARHMDFTLECQEPPFRPYNQYFVEGNTWHYTWDVSHDLDNFIAAWPSPAAFINKLEYALNRSTETLRIFEENKLPNPYYWQGNEHNLLYPWEFNKAGRADLTQYWVRWLLEHRYTENLDGLPGQDDYGTLSAWYVWGSLGLYPLAGADWYFIGSPVMDKATLSIGGGKTITITANNNSPTNVYIESVKVNGVELMEPIVTHAQLTVGSATIEFVMSSSPNTAFNVDFARNWRAGFDTRHGRRHGRRQQN